MILYSMAITPDQIVDRMKLKKQVVSWRFAAILFAVFLVLVAFVDSGNSSKKASLIDTEYVARIYINDVIFDDTERLDSLKALAENKAAKAVILHINTPGGTVVGGENLYNSIKKLKKQKPVVVVMGDVTASAGYMISVAADYLIAHQGTVTGSIGVISQSFEFTELANKVGVKFHNFKSSPLKGGPLPTEELSPEMKAAMQDTINDIYNVFVDMVAESRQMPREEVLKLADGRVFTGRQALKNKLIDAIGDEDTAMNWLKDVKSLPETLKIRDYALVKEPTKFDKLLNSLENTEINSLKSFLYKNLTLFS